MTPITPIDTGDKVKISLTESNTASVIYFVHDEFTEGPMEFEEIELILEELPSQDLLDSVEEFKEYEKKKGRKFCTTMREIEDVLG